MLGKTFGEMYRSTELMNDRKRVDITELKDMFSLYFDLERPQDAFRFLVHIMNGVTKETVDPAILEKAS